MGEATEVDVGGEGLVKGCRRAVGAARKGEGGAAGAEARGALPGCREAGRERGGRRREGCRVRLGAGKPLIGARKA